MNSLTLKLSILFAIVSLAGCAAEGVSTTEPTDVEDATSAQSPARKLDGPAPEIANDEQGSPLENVGPQTTVFPGPPQPWFTGHAAMPVDPAGPDAPATR